MSKLDMLKKLISPKTAEEAKALLGKIRGEGVEAATSLQGSDKEAYLKALDMVEGARDVRAKNMGFGEDTLYHGSPASDITEFRPTEQGIFASPSQEFANHFAELNRPGRAAEGTVYPVRMRTENKFDYKNPEQVKKAMEQMGESDPFVQSTIKSGDWLMMESPEMQNALKQLGHDSYNIAEELGPEFGKNIPLTKNTAVYDPSQVRSVNAAFDPFFKKSGNILAGGAGAAVLAAGNNAEASVDPKKPAVNLAPEELAKLTAYKKYLDDGGRRGEINRYLTSQKEIGDKMMDLEARPIWESRTPEEEAFYEENRRNPFFEGTQMGMNATGTVKAVGNAFPKLKTLFQAGSGEVLSGRNAAEALDALRSRELGSVMTRTTPEAIGSVKVKDIPKQKPGKVTVKD